MALGVWTDNGVVVAPVSSDTPGQPNVLYETGSVIIGGSNPVWKMWFGTANGVCYAESNSPTSGWTRYSSNPIIVPSGTKSTGWTGFPKIFKYNGTYYAYVINGNFQSMSSWTSTDGVTWAEQESSALSGWGVGTGFVGQLAVLGESGGTWYGYYTGLTYTSGTQYEIGYATSTDLLNWTGYSGNPVISAGYPSNFCFQQVGSLYYGWSQIVQAGIPSAGAYSVPSDISRFVSPSLTGPWTGPLSASTIYRTTAAEGVGLTLGQIADPCMILVNGTIYTFVTINTNGDGSTGYQISCLTAQGVSTFQELVQAYEGIYDVPQPSTNYGFVNQLHQLATDSFTSGDTNWTQLTSTSGWNAPTFGTGSASSTGNELRSTAYYSGGSISWPNDQWASATLLAVQNGSVYASVLLRSSTSGAATCYQVTIQGALGGGAFTYLEKFVANTLTQIAIFTHTWNVNDVVTFAVVGTTLSLYQNGNLLWCGSDSAIASGAPGISLYGDGTAAHCAFSAFSAGGFSTTIGGNVGVSGATVSDGTNTTTSDANGNFILSPEYGTVTITPSLTGYSFSPGSSSETVSGAPITGVNFTATPVYSISGNAGTPNAKVTWTNNAGDVVGHTTADGTGAYAIPSLADDTYSVFPYIANFTFAPNGGATVVVSGSNATQDFVASPVTPVSYVYSKVGGDTFTQADGPVDPAKWSSDVGYTALSVVSNECVGNSPFPGTGSSELYTGAGAWPNNVYVQMQVDHLVNDLYVTAEIDARSDAGGNVFSSLVIDNNLDSTLYVYVVGSDQITGIVIYSLPWSSGDVFRAEFYGTLVALYQNGTLIANGISDGVVGGTYGDLFLIPNAAQSDVQVSNFEFGSITLVPPASKGSSFGFGFKLGF